jgi:alkaline phosphatase D
LVRGFSCAALALAGGVPGRRSWRPRFAAYPFSLGVASGDPAPDGFVLWTRLAPDPLRGGGMPPESVDVRWEIARDEGMRRIVRRGLATAPPELAHSVHAEIDGLEPDRWYWYRFQVAGETSPVGRARTLPRSGARPAGIRFAFASCQHYEHGYFTAYRHLAGEELDLVVHLGDYIYEDAADARAVRSHTGGETTSLEDYRNRYALYKTDPDLQAAHATFPWVVTWDDHEVDNNYAGAHSEQDDPVDSFLLRRASAYQAYYEHQPVRAAARPRGPDARLYRSVAIGDLARFFVLDGRQYRSDQPCGDRRRPPCPGVFDPAATMLGPEQERWLLEGLRGSEARWNVLAQQVFLARVDAGPGEAEIYNMDSWNGYQSARQRLLDFLGERGTGDVVVLTGDVHSSWAAEVKRDFREERSPAIGTEFVGTSISSAGDGGEAMEGSDVILAENPHIKFHDARRGYVRCEIGRDLWRADYRTLPYVSRPDAPIGTRQSFTVERGRPGLL